MLKMLPTTDLQIHDWLTRISASVELSTMDRELVCEVRRSFHGGLSLELRAKAVNLIKRHEGKLP